MLNKHIAHNCLYGANHSIVPDGAYLCIYGHTLIIKMHFIRLGIKDIYTNST